MKPRLLGSPFLFRYGSLLFLFLLLCSAIASAQDADPYTLDPEKRSSASTPIPAGVIVNLAYPLWGTVIADQGDQDVELDKFLRYEIFGYIDAWQVGYLHQVYGDAFVFMPRTIGRDAYEGWYFLLGSQSGKQASAQFPTGVEFGRTIYGLGSRLTGGYDDKVGFSYDIDFMLGYASGNDVIVGDSVIGETGSSFLIKTTGSVGARIPVGISGMSIGAYGDLLFYPHQDDINGDLFIHIELGLKLTGAFNLNM